MVLVVGVGKHKGVEWLTGCGPFLMVFEDDSFRNECAFVLSQLDHYALLLFFLYNISFSFYRFLS